jgi:glycosyltransferase involved in cell wall biosynthesis
MVSGKRISAVIPAHNEGSRVGRVVEETLQFVDEVMVIDDGSEDLTRAEAKRAGAIVVRNAQRSGYIRSIKKGFQHADGDIYVTLDADGEHDPADIPKLVRPILDDKADLVFGRRTHVPRFSERIISRMVRKRLGGIIDSGTGFRAIEAILARRLELKGSCTCGILGLEAKGLDARITEVDVQERKIKKPRGVAWNHFGQIFRVLGMLMR